MRDQGSEVLMVALLAGTTAELIKLSPVMRELLSRDETPRIWWTGMHGPVPMGLLAQQRLAHVPIRTLHSPARLESLSRPLATLGWMGEVTAHMVRHRSTLEADTATGPSHRELVIVHGDTITTAWGSVVGRWIGATVAHVEAGLRSGSLRHPFPEEANRRITAKLADIHFAPSAVEVQNLSGCRGVVIETGANTAVDALRFALDGQQVERGDYGVATLHRFELVHDRDRFSEAITMLREHAEEWPIHFYAGASDLAALESSGLMHHFDDRLVLRAKLPHAEFVKQVVRARFVVTDSGGLQEECAYLGIPTLIHRARTERLVGLGENVVLSGFNRPIWSEFFRGVESLRRPSLLDRYRPSERIVGFLASAGFLATHGSR